MRYPFSLVLHTHLPMVVNHGRWPHGSDWLNEAAFECYLPLIETAHRLVADGVSPKWTVNISPVLTEQLASPEFQKELSFYYENVRRACTDSREYFAKEGQEDLVGLTHFWEEFYERMWELHRRVGGDIVGTFAELQRGGHIEIITCAATHGYLPLLSRDESIHLQLRTAVQTHRRHFGQAPRGIWLPECAYRPRYEWTPPTGRDSGRDRRLRPGIEEMLAVHGLEYFVADSHLVAAGDPIFLYRDYLPLREPRGETVAVPRSQQHSPYVPCRVASRGGTGSAIAFFRDPKTTLQVWSRDHGYPGEFAYLEFHKKHFPGGLRLWRITNASGDLGQKETYEPKVAAEKVGFQARHFVDLVQATLAEAAREGPAMVCSPYDAELFGHWWFEGPQWLEQVAREMATNGVQTMTLGESLEVVPPRATLSLPEGSWGEGGDHRVWLNRDTEWTWDRVYSAETEWASHLARLAPDASPHPDLHRVLAQATRELLLLQASDWQFLITTGAARDYAERRVAEHYADFKRLSEMARNLREGEPLTVEAATTLRRLERDDFCFPDLHPTWGTAP